jgi:HNH endonuclease
MRQRDEQLKVERGYTDPKSYVRPDGSETLYGEDWKRRVQELRERSGGRCERVTWWGEWLRCQSEAADPDHIIKRSKRRDDRMSNLQALCAVHHRAKHPEHQPQWSKK